jgi:hypothetical protein
VGGWFLGRLIFLHGGCALPDQIVLIQFELLTGGRGESVLGNRFAADFLSCAVLMLFFVFVSPFFHQLYLN